METAVAYSLAYSIEGFVCLGFYFVPSVPVLIVCFNVRNYCFASDSLLKDRNFILEAVGLINTIGFDVNW